MPHIYILKKKKKKRASNLNLQIKALVPEEVCRKAGSLLVIVGGHESCFHL